MKATQAEIDAFLAHPGVTAGPPARLGQEFKLCAELYRAEQSGPEMDMVDPNSATIPIPISANLIWRSIIIKGKVRVIKSKDYREWIEQALPCVAHMAARTKPAAVELVICGCTQGSDLDNKNKVVLDLLKKAQVIVNDNIKHVRRITVCWQAEKVGGEVAAIIRLSDA